MSVPSRAFVGILVFGLICTLTVLPYTVLVLSGYHPPPRTPYEALFPEPQGTDAGVKLVLVLASLFCLALVAAAWRGLVNGARLDRDVRAQRAGAAPPAKGDAPTVVEDQPPGYQ